MAVITRKVDFTKQYARWEELHGLLKQMGVPELRHSDINWLLSNLPRYYDKHNVYARAYELCKEIKKEITKALAAML